MKEEQNQINPVSDKTMKLGIKIEKPVDIKMHPIFPLMLILSFVLIGATLWLLSLEYLGEPPASWLRTLLENFVLTL